MSRLLTLNNGNVIAIDSNTYSSTNFNIETISTQKNLSNDDFKYQYLNNSGNSPIIVNLPVPTTANQKEFKIISVGNTLEIRENNNSLNLFLDKNGIIDCHCDGTNWNIFVKD